MRKGFVRVVDSSGATGREKRDLDNINLFATAFPRGTRKFISGPYKGEDANVAIKRYIREKKTLGERIGMASIPEIKKQYPRQFKQIQKLSGCQELRTLLNKFEDERIEQESTPEFLKGPNIDNDWEEGLITGMHQGILNGIADVKGAMKKRKCN